MHNGYLYPQDVKSDIIDGIRVVTIDFSLPVVWDEAAVNLSQKCYLSGWELARRTYEKVSQNAWFKVHYPEHHEESLLLREHLDKGGSICSFWMHRKEKRHDTPIVPDVSNIL